MQKFLAKNFWFIWVLILVFFIGGIWFLRAETAESLWQILRNPELALFFNPNAEFAFRIGNYYFNVYGDGVYDLNCAEKYFKKALELDPDIPGAWHQLARIDFLRSSFWSALEKINREIELRGDPAPASYYVRGLIHGYAGNFDEAESDFKKFLSLKPVSWAVHNDLAWVYFKKGDYKKVEGIARKGLRWNPDNPWLLTSLGVALLNLDKKAEAKEALERALAGAKKLTLADWHKAYPGNDPKKADEGLKNMIAAIELNLKLVKGIGDN